MLMAHHPTVDLDMVVVDFLGALRMEYEDASGDDVEFYENGGGVAKISCPTWLGF